MPRISALEAARLMRRRLAQIPPTSPLPSPLEALPFEVVVPGRLRNPLNASWGHWSKHAALARSWRDGTVVAIYRELTRRQLPFPGLIFARQPKRVTFTCRVGRLWDDDSLPAACKPIRDGIVDAQLCHADGPTAGHMWVYQQTVTPLTDRGVQVQVEASPTGA